MNKATLRNQGYKTVDELKTLFVPQADKLIV